MQHNNQVVPQPAANPEAAQPVPDERSEEAAASSSGSEEEEKKEEEEKVEDAKSQDTVESDVAEEEELSFANDKNFKPTGAKFGQKVLSIKSIQWQKDSHGLFDYEMRQIIRSQFTVDKTCKALRKGENIKFVPQGDDILEKYDDQHQELMKIYKLRNKYFIEGVRPADVNVDVDENYLEFGEPTLKPHEMKERMYNVVRFLKVNQESTKQNYTLKKNDVIKMGRIKLKVREVHHKERDTRFKERLKRRQHRIKEEALAKDPNAPDDVQIEGSKYPPNYLLLENPSIASIHEPIVGEQNYIEAPCPPKKKEEPSEEKKVEEEVKPAKNSTPPEEEKKQEEAKMPAEQMPVAPPSAAPSSSVAAQQAQSAQAAAVSD